MKFGYTAWVGNVRSLVSYFLKKTSLVIQIISMLAYTSVRISETNIRLDNRNAQCYNGSIVKINTIMCYRYSGTSNWLCENKERAFKNIWFSWYIVECTNFLLSLLPAMPWREKFTEILSFDICPNSGSPSESFEAPSY